MALETVPVLAVGDVLTAGDWNAVANNDVIYQASIGGLNPVGSVIISTTLSTAAAVEAIYGGTWVAYAAGRTVIGVGTSDETFSAGATGGASNTTLTTTELPTHNHGAPGNSNFWTNGSNPIQAGSGDNASAASNVTEDAGSGGSFSNLPPYVVAYLWQRTA